MDHPSRATELIDGIVAYDKFLDEEKERIRPLLLALRGEAGIRTDTTEVLLEVFRDSNPNTSWTAAEAEAAIRARGWDTESNDPVNAVRAALNRLKNNNEIENVGRGRYRLVPEDDDVFRDITDDDNSDGPVYEDPWGSPPPPVPEQKSTLQPATHVPFDDEPPF